MNRWDAETESGNGNRLAAADSEEVERDKDRTASLLSERCKDLGING